MQLNCTKSEWERTKTKAWRILPNRECLRVRTSVRASDGKINKSTEIMCGKSQKITYLIFLVFTGRCWRERRGANMLHHKCIAEKWGTWSHTRRTRMCESRQKLLHELNLVVSFVCQFFSELQLQWNRYTIIGF